MDAVSTADVDLSADEALWVDAVSPADGALPGGADTANFRHSFDWAAL